MLGSNKEGLVLYVGKILDVGEILDVEKILRPLPKRRGRMAHRQHIEWILHVLYMSRPATIEVA